MSDALLAALPSSGMMPVDPGAPSATELLQLCTVMGWKPKLPLQVMRDDMAKRWFLRGEPGKQDFWIRDNDLDALRATPMWKAVVSAAPYGRGNLGDIAKARLDTREAFSLIIDDDASELDPVVQEKNELAKARLEAEERLRKIDDWE